MNIAGVKIDGKPVSDLREYELVEHDDGYPWLTVGYGANKNAMRYREFSAWRFELRNGQLLYICADSKDEEE